jgi:hypothetical protein
MKPGSKSLPMIFKKGKLSEMSVSEFFFIPVIKRAAVLQEPLKE